MYQIVATNDFVELLKDLPLKYISVLVDSFVSIKKIDSHDALKSKEYSFIDDLLNQIKNQEID